MGLHDPIELGAVVMANVEPFNYALGFVAKRQFGPFAGHFLPQSVGVQVLKVVLQEISHFGQTLKPATPARFDPSQANHRGLKGLETLDPTGGYEQSESQGIPPHTRV